MYRVLVGGVIVLLAIFVLMSSQSMAAENVINGCLNKKTGALRVVSDPSKCRKYETPISWNQTGPQGIPGPQGKQGPQGLQGLQGPPGVTVQVYDANGQYLGILMHQDGQSAQIYIPSIGKFINSRGYMCDYYNSNGRIELYYEGSDCSGQAYSGSTFNMRLLNNSSSDSFYLFRFIMVTY